MINVRKAVDKSFAGEAEDVPVLSTSVAYGVYMAVSSNLRYVVLKEINIYNYSRLLGISVVSCVVVFEPLFK